MWKEVLRGEMAWVAQKEDWSLLVLVKKQKVVIVVSRILIMSNISILRTIVIIYAFEILK